MEERRFLTPLNNPGRLPQTTYVMPSPTAGPWALLQGKKGRVFAVGRLVIVGTDAFVLVLLQR